MNAVQVFDDLKNRKGQHVQIAWQRAAKILKSARDTGHIVMKRTVAYVRAGINYSNLQDVRDAIEKGEREPVEGLPWGEWREGFQNFIIDHNDTEYIRLYPAAFRNLQESEVTWLLDGKEVDFATVEPYLLASEKRDKDEKPAACFTVKAADVVTIAD
jgi:hypothetical protein